VGDIGITPEAGIEICSGGCTKIQSELDDSKTWRGTLTFFSPRHAAGQ